MNCPADHNPAPDHNPKSPFAASLAADDALSSVEGFAPVGPKGRRVILMRHGQTTWNTQGRWQGHSDPPLDDYGVEQAQRAAKLLASLRPDVLISSDLQRATTTAFALAHATGLDVHTDPRLRETDIGLWSGLTTTEIQSRWPGNLDRWFVGEVDFNPSRGENRLQVAARMVAAIGAGLRRVPDGGCLVAVTHGGAARVAIASILGLEHTSWAAIGGLSNCCWSLLGERAGQPDYPVRWRLVEHNAGSLPEPILTEEG